MRSFEDPSSDSVPCALNKALNDTMNKLCLERAKGSEQYNSYNSTNLLVLKLVYSPDTSKTVVVSCSNECSYGLNEHPS